MGTGRIGYLDLARGLCICIVMLFHVNGIMQCEFFGDKVLFSSFTLPPFFFISGLLFKAESFRTFFIKKVNRLLMPFLFFYLISAVIIPNALHFAAGVNFETVTGWRSLWAFVWPGQYPNVPLWFLWCLFLINLLFWLINNLCGRWFGNCSGTVMVLLCVCFSMAGAYAEPFFKVDVACVIKTFKFILFFCVGYLARGYINNVINHHSGWKMTLFLLVSFAIAFIPAVSYRCDNVLLEAVVFCCSGLAGSVFILLLCSLISHLPVISYLGENSIVIMATHGLLIRAITSSVVRLSYSIGPYCSVILFWLLMALSYLLLIPVFKFCLPHFTAQKPIFRL